MENENKKSFKSGRIKQDKILMDCRFEKDLLKRAEAFVDNIEIRTLPHLIEIALKQYVEKRERGKGRQDAN